MLDFVRDNLLSDGLTYKVRTQRLNDEFGCGLHGKAVSNLICNGTADVLCLLNANGLRVPFRDLATLDDNGNGIWTDAAIENMRRFSEPERVPVVTTPAQRVPHHPRDIRDTSTILASLYTVADPDTCTVTLNPGVELFDNGMRLPEFLDNRRRIKRNLTVDATFVFLLKNYPGLFRPFLPDDLLDGREDADLSSIDPNSINLDHEGKRSAILEFLRTTRTVPVWYEPAFLAEASEIRQCSRDEEIKKTLAAIDANIYSQWDFVNVMVAYWSDMVSSFGER